MSPSDAIIRRSPYVHAVPHASGWAVYHSLHGNLCVVDAEVLGMLDAFETPRTVGEVAQATGQDVSLVAALADALRDRRFLVDPGLDEREAVVAALAQRRERASTGTLVGVLQMVMTNRCNFRCKYCFTERIYCSDERARLQRSHDNQMMAPATARAAVDLLLDKARAAGRSDVTVQFFGGEPLINWSLIQEVLRTYGDGSAHGVHITYTIVTNGSLVTDEIASELAARDVAVIVSFDSPKGHDRLLAAGGGTRARVERSLELLASRRNRIVFNSVLSEETFPYFGREVVDFGLRFGVREIGVLFDLDPAFYARRPPVQIADRVWDLYGYAKERGVQVTGYWHQIFAQIAGQGVLAGRAFKTCSATGAQLSVEPSGDVFACKGSSGYFGHVSRPDELFGSARYQRYAMQALQNAPSCEDCEIELTCGGLCLGSREKQFGDISAVEPSSCEVFRDLTRRLLSEVDVRMVDVLQVA